MRKIILIIAGGTGGHIFPALALARELNDSGDEVHWLGSHVGMERELIGNEFSTTFISVKAFRYKGITSKLLFPVHLLRSTWQALCVIKKIKPDLVVGLGGFVSAPGALATKLLRKPLVIHEQNAVAGMTNRFLARIATCVLQGFPDAFPQSISAKTVGNPVRRELVSIADPKDRYMGRRFPLRLLVLGGSRGSSDINQFVFLVLQKFRYPTKLTVWHQTGKLDIKKLRRDYTSILVPVRVEAFIQDMKEAYSWADLVICRSGALTVSEIAMVGLPSIVIPYPHAVDDHQFYNAQTLEKVGAATLIRQSELTIHYLQQWLEKSLDDRNQLLEMAIKAKSINKPNALSDIVKVCHQIIQ